MALLKVEHIIEFVDVNGDTATVRMPSSADDSSTTLPNLETVNSGLAAALVANSNGKVIGRSCTLLFDKAQLVVGVAPPTSAIYPSVTDGARLQFANNRGERTSVTIPAPVAAVFGAASNIVNSVQAQVAALIAFYQTNAVDEEGNPFNLYKGGIKVGRRARRRRSSLVP